MMSAELFGAVPRPFRCKAAIDHGEGIFALDPFGEYDTVHCRFAHPAL